MYILVEPVFVDEEQSVLKYNPDPSRMGLSIGGGV